MTRLIGSPQIVQNRRRAVDTVGPMGIMTGSLIGQPDSEGYHAHIFPRFFGANDRTGAFCTRTVRISGVL